MWTEILFKQNINHLIKIYMKQTDSKMKKMIQFMPIIASILTIVKEILKLLNSQKN